jgi:hypothetical protein
VRVSTLVYAAQTDKASMLEEIIEYIKFLQLQTKVSVQSVTFSQFPSPPASALMPLMYLIEGSEHEQAGRDRSRRSAPDGVSG